MESKIVVLDFGSQYTHLLARRIRELKVYSEIMAPTVPSDSLKDASGIILSGGPKSVYEKDAIAFNPEIFSLKIPILGLCYGQQLIGKHFGAEVGSGKVKEYGKAKISTLNSELFKDLPRDFTVWMSHGDKIELLAEGFQKIASTKDCEFAAIEDPEKKIFALQFHPEVTHTENGLKILSNFVFNICRCSANWTMKHYLDEQISNVRKECSGKNVFLLLSGGVDSTVALSLLGKAIGSARIHALHVDTGFMRKNESAIVKKELGKLGIQEINVIEAQGLFEEKLKGIVDPEKKRNIIGKLFVDIALEELNNLNFDTENWLVGQGTIYPDTIETGGSENSNKIKTHHNRAPVIMEMIEKGLVIEPLKYLYKDEVREIGKLLGLAEKLVNRHPFPGPGLAIRILCSKGADKVDKEIEKKVNEVSIKHGYRATILPLRAVGVQGDNRTYRNVALLEGKIDYESLERISTKITNSFNSINRVIVLLGNSQVNSIELKEAYLTKERVEKLKEADFQVMNVLQQRKIYDKIWQFPVVLLPVNFDGSGEGVVLRPVESREAMTANFAKIDYKILQEIYEQVKKIKGVGAVMLDVTHKPPATIEWE